MITRSYDAVVLGPSPGATVAAVLLAARGRQVLVVDRRDRVARSGAWVFPSHDRPMLGFDGGTLFPHVLKALQVHPRELRVLRCGTPSHQVITTAHRYDVYPDADRTLDELRREIPHEAGALARFLVRAELAAGACSARLMASLAAAGRRRFWHSLGLGRARWQPAPAAPEDTLDAALRAEGVGDEGRTWVLAQVAPFLGLERPQDLPLGIAAVSLMAALDGWFVDPDEPDGWDALLRRRVEGIKVDLVDEADPDEWICGWRAVRELRFTSRAEPVQAGALILGTDPGSWSDRLPEPRSQAWDRAQARLTPSRFRYSVHLGVRSEAIPVGMADQVILAGDSAGGPGDDGFVLLSLSPDGAPGVPEGCRALTASADLPRALATDPPGLAAAADRLLERLAVVMPFADRHVVTQVLPRLAPASQSDPTPSRVETSVYDWSPAGLRTGLMGGLGVQLPLRNTFFAGRGALLGLGLEGELIAGMAVDRLVSASLARG